MAGLKCTVITVEVALVAATAKTVLQLVAPTNQRLVVNQIGVFFDGVSAANEPVVVGLYRNTSAGTMSALTPVKVDALGSEVIQSTAQFSATVEPVLGDLIDSWEIHPQAGLDIFLPLGQEIVIPGGGRLGLACTAPQGVNVLSKFGYEE